MTAVDERAVYADLLGWLLEEAARTLEDIPPDELDRSALPGTTAPGALAAHMLGATRTYVLGFGCDAAVERDRPSEFASAGLGGDTLALELRALASAIEKALSRLDPARLDERLTPPQQLFGEAPTHEISRRWAIASSIRHCGQHLGHLQLTRDVIRERAG